MWYSIQTLARERLSLRNKHSEFEQFARENREKFCVIGKEYGDDIDGLPNTNGRTDDLYVSSFHLGSLVDSFLKSITGKFLTLERAQQLEESIGWLSNLTEIDQNDRITLTNNEDTHETFTKYLHELAGINRRRKEILEKFKNK